MGKHDLHLRFAMILPERGKEDGRGQSWTWMDGCSMADLAVGCLFNAVVLPSRLVSLDRFRYIWTSDLLSIMCWDVDIQEILLASWSLLRRYTLPVNQADKRIPWVFLSSHWVRWNFYIMQPWDFPSNQHPLICVINGEPTKPSNNDCFR